MWSQPGTRKNTASQNNKRGPKAWKVPRKVTVTKGVGNSSRIKAQGRIADRNSKEGAGMREREQGQCGGPEVTATRKLLGRPSPNISSSLGPQGCNGDERQRKRQRQRPRSGG